MADEKGLRAGDEDDAGAVIVERPACGLDPLDGKVDVVEVAAEIHVLDRQARDAGFDAEDDIGDQVLGIVGEAVEEVGVDRHVGDCGDLADMLDITSRDSAPSA